MDPGGSSSAFFGWRGHRKIIKPVGNIFEDKTDKSIHSTIKPVPGCSTFSK